MKESNTRRFHSMTTPLFMAVLFATMSGCLFQNPSRPVITDEVVYVTRTEATINVTISANGGDLIEKGICVGIAPNPTVADARTPMLVDGLSFQVPVSLTRGKVNYARAFAVTGAGIGYGNELEIPIVIDDNGIVWEQAQFNGFVGQQLRKVIWADSNFVAVGDGGLIFTSSSGLDWTLQQSNSTAGLRGLVWDGQIVAVGEGGTILTSSDGKSWTVRQSGLDVQFVAIAGNNNILVAVGYTNSTHQTIIYTSTDGISWTQNAFNPLPSSGISDITWANDQFVAVGSTAGKMLVLTSPDGIDWTNLSVDIGDYNVISILWTGSQLVGVGNNSPMSNSIVVTSTDATSWDTRIVDGKSFYCITYSGNNYVAGGTSSTPGQPGGIFTSSDLQTWQGQSLNNFYTIASVVWGGDRYVAVGNPFFIFMSDY